MTQVSDNIADSAPNTDRLAPRLAVSPDAIAEFCERWRITEMALFGSVLRDDYDSESDIDVLVEFEPDGVPGLRFVSMAKGIVGSAGQARGCPDTFCNRTKSKLYPAEGDS